MVNRLQNNNGYRLLTVEIGLVRIVHQHAIVLRVTDTIAVDVWVTFVSFTVAVRVQLIRIRYFGAIVHAVLYAVPAIIFFFFLLHPYFTCLSFFYRIKIIDKYSTCLCQCHCRKRRLSNLCPSPFELGCAYLDSCRKRLQDHLRLCLFDRNSPFSDNYLHDSTRLYFYQIIIR